MAREHGTTDPQPAHTTSPASAEPDAVAARADELAHGSGPLAVVEPHADDAFLSLGGSIAAWTSAGRDVTVVTVYSDDPARNDEAAAWAESVGARWVGLGQPSNPAEGFRLPTDIAPLPSPLLPEALAAPTVTRVWPLGLEHPEHAAVADAAPAGELRYVDTPYLLSATRQADVADRLRGRRIAWWLHPPAAKWDGVALFPSQALLFRLYPVEQLRGTPEIIVA